MNIHIHSQIYKCEYAHTHTCRHRNILTHRYTNVNTHTHTYIHMYVCSVYNQTDQTVAAGQADSLVLHRPSDADFQRHGSGAGGQREEGAEGEGAGRVGGGRCCLPGKSRQVSEIRLF